MTLALGFSQREAVNSTARGLVKPVTKPTTIEEYTILRYFGGYLNVTNMPEVIKPKP